MKKGGFKQQPKVTKQPRETTECRTWEPGHFQPLTNFPVFNKISLLSSLKEITLIEKKVFLFISLSLISPR